MCTANLATSRLQAKKRKKERKEKAPIETHPHIILTSEIPLSDTTMLLVRDSPGSLIALSSQTETRSSYLVISKLQPFRRSRALFRMMPLSLPRYAFLSEFMGAGQAGRLWETKAPRLWRLKKKKKKIERLTVRQRKRETNRQTEKLSLPMQGSPPHREKTGMLDRIGG